MCTDRSHAPFCSIVPPNILVSIAENGNKTQKELAFQALQATSRMRGQREVLTLMSIIATTSTGTKRRTVYDAQTKTILPGKLVRSEGDPKSKDVAVNEAYDGAGKTYDFYKKIFNRNSIDDKGMRLDSSVHYRKRYNNAVWNGQQMAYGDGDGQIFNRFTKSLDVIGHELTHGVTQYEANLVYEGQSGALNEHFSDVFGSLVKQWSKGETAKKADWLIGQGLFTTSVNGVALRSMKQPGTAYDDPLIGKDPQPDHMSKFVNTTEDEGGVHINSGIPNKAFYELAVSLGGNAWDKAGRIWYITLRDRLLETTEFQECAEMTYEVAQQEFSGNATVAQAVKAAWAKVGIKV